MDDGAEDLGHPIKAILNLRNRVQRRTVDLGSVPSLNEAAQLCGCAFFWLLTFAPRTQKGGHRLSDCVLSSIFLKSHSRKRI